MMCLKRVFFFGLVVLSLMIVMWSPSWASNQDDTAENAVLEQMLDEIDSLESLVNQAASIQQKEGPQRVHFHYVWLRNDLEKIRHGIDEKLNLPPIEPRVVAPIRGDYVKTGG